MAVVAKDVVDIEKDEATKLRETFLEVFAKILDILTDNEKLVYVRFVGRMDDLGEPVIVVRYWPNKNLSEEETKMKEIEDKQWAKNYFAQYKAIPYRENERAFRCYFSDADDEPREFGVMAKFRKDGKGVNLEGVCRAGLRAIFPKLSGWYDY